MTNTVENVVPLKLSPNLNEGETAEEIIRIPPRSEEAEQALIAAILHNNQTYERVSEFLLPEHFSIGAHQKIFKAIATLIERGEFLLHSQESLGQRK